MTVAMAPHMKRVVVVDGLASFSMNVAMAKPAQMADTAMHFTREMESGMMIVCARVWMPVVCFVCKKTENRFFYIKTQARTD